MNLLIYGAGGLGREVAELAKIISKWDEIFFIDDYLNSGTLVNGIKTFKYDEFKQNFDVTNIEAIIGVGEPVSRKALYNKLISDNVKMATMIHPTVHISETNKIGKGVIVQAYSQITVNVVIEENVLIQDKVSIGHDTHIKSHSVISGGAMIAGHVSVGDSCYIAMGVPVIQNSKIGSNSIIGLGSVVIRDIPDNVIALGNPARPMKEKNDNFALK